MRALKLNVSQIALSFKYDNDHLCQTRLKDSHLEDQGIERMEWPSRSLDLIPIEYLWYYRGTPVTFGGSYSYCRQCQHADIIFISPPSRLLSEIPFVSKTICFSITFCPTQKS
ncbi:hypothetical protein AVEN_53754-1 [Araneus ventricosus]|uniref:Uncharacterized protein n=1 Tax=Araneus ventricosus TaxID=182803 RepID=A0A4Y2MXV0_ARAVE|nr:hypothetical protein AVEN_53754-1 [Araneus ventricosus]